MKSHRWYITPPRNLSPNGVKGRFFNRKGLFHLSKLFTLPTRISFFTLPCRYLTWSQRASTRLEFRGVISSGPLVCVFWLILPSRQILLNIFFTTFTLCNSKLYFTHVMAATIGFDQRTIPLFPIDGPSAIKSPFSTTSPTFTRALVVSRTWVWTTGFWIC